MKRIDENEFRNKGRLYYEYSEGKNVLRQAMMDFIPERILKRNKQGFSAPDESWYRGENAIYLTNLLLGKRASSSEFISPEYIRRIIEDHIEKRANHRLLLWSFMCFEWWCRLFLGKEILPL
jgi:asparagine synthase (glutamine-hydrolysing)